MIASDRCTQCGAPVNEREPRCSFCGAGNTHHRAALAELDALVARGIEAVRAGRHADAVDALGRAIARDDALFDAHVYLAAAWNALDQTERALAAITAAAAIRPGSAPMVANVAALQRALGRRAEAVASFKRALALVDRDPALDEQARAEIRRSCQAQLQALSA